MTSFSPPWHPHHRQHPPTSHRSSKKDNCCYCCFLVQFNYSSQVKVGRSSLFYPHFSSLCYLPPYYRRLRAAIRLRCTAGFREEPPESCPSPEGLWNSDFPLKREGEKKRRWEGWNKIKLRGPRRSEKSLFSLQGRMFFFDVRPPPDKAKQNVSRRVGSPTSGKFINLSYVNS